MLGVCLLIKQKLCPIFMYFDFCKLVIIQASSSKLGILYRKTKGFYEM